MSETQAAYRVSRRAEAGNRARLEGQSFQDALAYMHRRYEADGRAVVLEAGTRARARKGPDGTLHFIAAPSLPDYIIIVRPSAGEPPSLVAFDAKSTGDRAGWSLPRKSLHQKDLLSRLAGIGVPAFFLVECRPRGICYAIRIAPGLEGVAFPRIRFDEFRYAAIEEDGYGHYDWLAALEAWGWLG